MVLEDGLDWEGAPRLCYIIDHETLNQAIPEFFPLDGGMMLHTGYQCGQTICGWTT